MNAKWTWRMSPSTSLNANFYRGYDQYEYNYNNEFVNEFDNFEIKNQEIFSENRTWSNNGYSLILDHQWNKQWQSSLTFGHTSYQSEGGSSSMLIRRREIFRDTISIANSGINEVKNYNFNWKNVWKIFVLKQKKT